MEVCAEAKRVMVHALSKMYSSRNQRGGIPLHRSLLLTLVMRAARDAYHSAHQSARLPEHGTDTSGTSEPSSTSSSPVPAAHHAQTEELMDTGEHEPPRGLQSGERTLKQKSSADKENCTAAGHQPQSRKRRGNSGAEPDFLPCKKARLEPAELRRVLQDSSARRNSGSCARDTEPLSATHTHTNITRTIVTF